MDNRSTADRVRNGAGIVAGMPQGNLKTEERKEPKSHRPVQDVTLVKGHETGKHGTRGSCCVLLRGQFDSAPFLHY